MRGGAGCHHGDGEQTSLGMGSVQRSRPWERQPVKITIYSAWCLAGQWMDPRAALPGFLLYIMGRGLLSQLGIF